MRYLIPVFVLMALVATGEMAGWSTGSKAVEAQVAQDARQQAREGTIPTSGYRF